PKPYFRLVDGRLVEYADHVRLSPSRRLALWLSQRSVLFNWVLDATHVDRARYQREVAGGSLSEPGEKAFEVTFALVRRVHDEAEAHGAWFVAFLYPSLRDFIRPSRRAARFLEAPELRGVVVVDLLPRFEAAGFTRETFARYALDGNLHLTREGHALAARVLLEVLREKGPLPAAAGGSRSPTGPGAPSSPSAP